jgi:hypothetical protein
MNETQDISHGQNVEPDWSQYCFQLPHPDHLVEAHASRVYSLQLR